MPEYKINDDWVLKRVSKQSTSFNSWVKDLVANITKIVQDKEPKIAAAVKQSEQDLPDLVAMEDKLKSIEEKVAKTTKKIERLGSIGSFVSDLTSGIQDKISQEMANKGGYNPEEYTNIDFIRGKRKTLSSALLDVAKERGITNEGILYLIQSLPDFESFLYGTSAGKFYRDHTEHQLRVAVLGDFLLEQDLENGQLVGIISELSGLDKDKLKNEIWWMTGLIHDIGYPLQKMTDSINFSMLNQILKCYPALDLEITPLEVTLAQKNTNQMEYLSFIEEGLSKEAIILIRDGAGLNHKTFPKPNVVSFYGSESGHEEYKYKNPIRLDHGVIGALTILRSLGTPEEIKEKKDEYIGYIKAAQAIALHNFKDKIKDFNFANNPLPFYLVLLDEMQEWGRPISLQVRDSYFTTELKKITLLDDVLLVIDEMNWVMAYKNMKAKELSQFDFKRFCNAKDSAFERLTRGDTLPEMDIILRDFEVDNAHEQTKKSTNIEEILEAVQKTTELQEKTGKEIEKLLEEKAKKRDRKEKEQSKSKDLVKSTKSSMNLLAEHKITI